MTTTLRPTPPAPLCRVLLFIFYLAFSTCVAQKPAFKVIAIAEHGGLHQPYVDAAKSWLNKVAVEQNFVVDYIENAENINDEYLSGYQLFIQLNYPPYMWSDVAKASFEKAMTGGTIGWIGFHHASLLGEFDGYKMWPWFSDWMGGIRWKNYIATFVSGEVKNEAPAHPVMQGIPASFLITKEEFYTYDKSPRPGVHVLASVDESTYKPASAITMGDHPVIWSNEKVKARNVYIFMGHDAGLFDNPNYKRLFSNAIQWAVVRKGG